MFGTLAIALFVLWILGLTSGLWLGGFIHVFLVASLLFFLIQATQGYGREDKDP
jgi:hypothetical protein